MMRHSGKQILTKSALLASLVAAVLALAGVQAATAANSRITHAYVIDPLTGAALGGYDPVSYFTSAEPLPGKADFEYYWEGVSWFFANAANRDVFSRAPEIYAPQYGGYGAMSMARGFLSDGNPLVYEVLDNRLYVFYSPGNRQAFLTADGTARLNATDKWKVISAGLPRL